MTDKNLNLLNNLELKFPLKISKLIEKINVKMIKIKTKEQSEINIGSYILNLNARILVLNSKIIHLTEKEVNLIMFLNKSENQLTLKNFN